MEEKSQSWSFERYGLTNYTIKRFPPICDPVFPCRHPHKLTIYLLICQFARCNTKYPLLLCRPHEACADPRIGQEATQKGFRCLTKPLSAWFSHFVRWRHSVARRYIRNYTTIVGRNVQSQQCC